MAGSVGEKRCGECQHGNHEYCLQFWCVCYVCGAGETYDPEKDVATPDLEGEPIF